MKYTQNFDGGISYKAATWRSGKLMEYNRMLNLREIGCENVGWIQLAQDRVQRLAVNV